MFSAVTFLEYWKRKSASLAHHWDCMGFQVRSGGIRWGFYGISCDFSWDILLGSQLLTFWCFSPLQDEEERPRPEFAAKAPYTEKNPITGVREPYFPKSARLRRIAAGSGLIILMVCCHPHSHLMKAYWLDIVFNAFRILCELLIKRMQLHKFAIYSYWKASM